MYPHDKLRGDPNSFWYQLKQQILRAWQPVPTINSTIVIFILLSIFFLGFGIALLLKTLEIVEIVERYDDKCQNQVQCIITTTSEITEEIKAPIYIYYELDNFYQNYRRYMKSQDIQQLMGTVKNVDELKSGNCDPVFQMKDLYTLKSYDGSTTLSPDDPANPCGLIARSMFNDTYQVSVVTSQGENNYPINEKGIAWPSDKEYKFKSPPNANKIQWINVGEDEHFMVWMRTAALPHFRKLWGKIEQNIPKGAKIKITIQNNYDVSTFEGKKYIVFSTTNIFGGKNMFLSIAYIVVGGLCLLIAIFFLIKKYTTPSRFPELKNK